MFKESFKKVLKAIGDKTTVVVGAGRYGLELATELIDKDVRIACFFDNSDDLVDLSAYGIKIQKPYKIDDEKIIQTTLKKATNLEIVKHGILIV